MYCTTLEKSLKIGYLVQINVNTDQYARVVIGNCFKAMNLENNQAIEKFPRLLELIERYPETANEFRHNVSQI